MIPGQHSLKTLRESQRQRSLAHHAASRRSPLATSAGASTSLAAGPTKHHQRVLQLDVRSPVGTGASGKGSGVRKVGVGRDELEDEVRIARGEETVDLPVVRQSAGQVVDNSGREVEIASLVKERAGVRRESLSSG